ncbi:type VII secretion target [Rhodococcus erythropolis]|uniref:type VII secretion target n=1 Tax=Rhodococcus erythropolis TaxID=1833 RepID=UPI001E50DA51|nr:MULTISPECIES: type VII secretion target [Rhodococcus erythropolis group]MCD2108770.1 ESX-1 secretion-associated protein [Rhodococcus qingshengii]MCZ4527681.1 type VII secretion target [Rhodococcus erythropolis]
MSELTVVPEDIRKYGSTSAEAAGHIAQAAVVDLGANIAAVAPVVGPVGIEFLDAFARAQATHTKDVAALATFYAGNAATAAAAAQAYDTTDHAIASDLTGVAGSIGVRA